MRHGEAHAQKCSKSASPCAPLCHPWEIPARWETCTDSLAALPGCRLAFYGRLCRTLDPGDPSQLLSLRVFKPKQREVRGICAWGHRCALL